MNAQIRTVLVADDDMDDRELLQEAFRQLDPQLKVHNASAAKEAMSYLHSCTEETLPGLIVLDYNMPGMNGVEVLEQLAGSKLFRNIPTVIWSTSNSPHQKKLCEEAGAKLVVTKPHSMKDIVTLAERMLALRPS